MIFNAFPLPDWLAIWQILQSSHSQETQMKSSLLTKAAVLIALAASAQAASPPTAP